MEDQWWPDVDWPDGPSEQTWPDVHDMDYGTVIDEAFRKAREGLGHFAANYVIVSKKLGKQLQQLGYHAPIVTYDDTYLYRRTQPIEDAAEGFRRLKSGRQMPIVVKGSGPRKDPHRRRGNG